MKKMVWTALVAAWVFLACSFPGLIASPTHETETAQTKGDSTIFPAVTPTRIIEVNIARGASVTSTRFLPGFEPEKAIDGISEIEQDNWWSAGDGPPQQIEIDLGGPFDISRIRLVTSQTPEGETRHLILGRRPGESTEVTLGELSGLTKDAQELILATETSWAGFQHIIVRTVDSPSWVAWREIEVYGKPGASLRDVDGTVTATPVALIEADLIFVNGNILTMDPETSTAQAIAIKDDKILAVGSNEAVRLHRGIGTRVVDLAGWTVTPGFIDSHTHRIGDRWLYGYGEQGPEQVIQEAIEGGWTSLHEMFVDQGRLDELTALAAAGDLRTRVSMYLTMNFQFERDDWWSAYQPLTQYNPYLQIAGLKITLDQEWGETVFFDPQQLTDMVLFAAERGWQVATHAFTPSTNMMILNAYEAAITSYPGQDLRFRLEHIGVIDDAGLEQMARLGVIGSVQFTNTSLYIEDTSFKRYIPESQRQLVSRWRDLIGAGVVLTGNTDAPWCCTPWRDPAALVTTAPAMDALYQAVARIPNSGLPPEAWQLLQAVSAAEALEMMTIRGAYAAHQEDVLGSLSRGKYADLVVLSADPLTAAPEDIREIEVLLVLIGGKTEYCLPGQAEICP